MRVRPFHDDVRSHLYDDTIHLIDALRYFCGDGSVIHTELRVDQDFIGGTCLIGLENGGIAQIITSMRAGQWREQYLLAGDGLTLEVDAFQQLKISQGDEQRTWREDYDSGKDTTTGRGFRGEIQHFFDCVASREQPHTDAWDSVKTQQLVEAMAGG
jgi:virulence factor